ncbi:segregation/condensation protein A, partial [Geoglobus sp.]
RMKSDIITSEAIGIVDDEEEQYPEIDYEYGYDDYHDYEYFEHADEFEEFLSQEFLHEGDVIEDELISALIEAGRKRVRRYTTLEDLIRELESAERVRKRRRRKRRAEKGHVVDPMEVPHDENLEEVIEKVREVVTRMMKNRDIVRLGEIAGFDLVSKYISVLHLAFRRVFEIRQERIFESDIEIRRLDDEGEG